MHRHLRQFLTLSALLASTAVAAEQTPAPTAAAVGSPAPSASGYTYDGRGRRDPFVSLVAGGSNVPVSSRPTGLGGLLIGEVTVKGIIRDRSGFIAMVQGPDTKTFTVRSGEKLMDGSVKTITPDSVVFSQEVTDPLSLVKQKEVRKMVRSL